MFTHTTITTNTPKQCQCPKDDPKQPGLSEDPKSKAGALKCPLWLLPTIGLRSTAWVLKTGADKYGPYNWRDNEVRITDYVSAMKRHLDDFLDGSDADVESGFSELAHIAATCFILMDAQQAKTLIDDRPATEYQLCREDDLDTYTR